jgi:hypothetical protein
MSGSLGPALVSLVGIAAAAVFIYAAFWAFSIRRALVGRIYRNHALWLGVLSIILLSIFLTSLVPTTDRLLSIALTDAPAIAVVLGFFAFVDSTVPIARRSDPLLRSILNWGKVRFVGWSLIILVEILGVYFDITNTAGTTGFGAGFGGLLLFLIGAPPMLIGARRSKDPNLRGSLKWFGLALLFFIGILLVGIVESALNLSTYDTSAIPYASILVLVGYALYKSARSLAPMNRLSAVESVTISSPNAVKS